MKEFKAGKNEAGQRLDKYLKRYFQTHPWALFTRCSGRRI